MSKSRDHEKPKLPKGTLCKVVVEDHGYIDHGELIEFLSFSTYGYTFKIADGSGKRITLDEETDFMVLPYEGSLRSVIDLALKTGDREWFKELLFQLETESVLK